MMMTPWALAIVQLNQPNLLSLRAKHAPCIDHASPPAMLLPQQSSHRIWLQQMNMHYMGGKAFNPDIGESAKNGTLSCSSDGPL